ncbi:MULTISPECIES: 2-hydroxyacid dehydrogenase [unclassified Nocardioides]|uniref:2-hydroxyacid dehydrogenase n=1 Tax=unclassified Nocardioides TaxID=2615069 RepID=UPI002406DE72|nr:MULTISPECIES: 2-hydroxyacid dehydrogenase [unclassified Nocardioides]MDF9716751.1 2-hydroxyacid dehydrogenase [Nocardioides sp. ChNu-99]
MASVWMDFDRSEVEEVVGPLPDGLTYARFDGEHEPDGIDEVEFYVPPYFGKADPAIVTRMPALRVVQAPSAGVDHLLGVVPEGVALCRAAGVHDPGTAELAVALLLAAQRDLPRWFAQQQRGEWSQANDGPSVADRRVLIVGYGSIGEAIHRRLEGFECEVVPVATKARTGPHGPVHGVDELPTLLPTADVVIVVTPLTDATRGLVDADFLAALPDGALLVNVGRGKVVDTEALLAELSTGRLRAALDVVDPEPLPADHPLWSAPGTIITPHVAGGTTAMRPRLFAIIAENLRRHVAGEEPLHAVAR